MPSGETLQGGRSAAVSERPDAVARMRPAVFRNIVVYPTQELLRPPFTLYRGGPDWPNFWWQRRVRHCRFNPGIPLDLRPWRTATRYPQYEEGGVWCGPVSQHFGHAIATFGSRIATAVRLSTHLPLIFSARAGEQPPGFFWEILRHFGAAPSRVKLVQCPTLFGELAVTGEAEPAFTSPHPSYLDLLDALVPSPLFSRPAPSGDKLYVSRAGMWKGKIAGESYIENCFAAIGYHAFRPETLPLAEQLAAYRNASEIVFADGSALHALQLLGRLSTQVTVIARAARRRTARPALRARGPAPIYVDAITGVLAGLGRNGRRQSSAGISILDADRLLSAFDRRNVPLRQAWRDEAFRDHEIRDLEVWTGARLAHPPHPDERREIQRSLARLQLSVDLPQ